MALGRVDRGGGSADKPTMTKDQVYAEMRRLGEFRDPNHPGYGAIRLAAIAALVTTSYPKVDAEHAARIFDVFRKNPALLPSAPPSKSD